MHLCVNFLKNKAVVESGYCNSYCGSVSFCVLHFSYFITEGEKFNITLIHLPIYHING